MHSVQNKQNLKSRFIVVKHLEMEITNIFNATSISQLEKASIHTNACTHPVCFQSPGVPVRGLTPTLEPTDCQHEPHRTHSPQTSGDHYFLGVIK